jgi:transposase
MRRQHSAEFKREAVRQVTEQGKGITEVARTLEISRTLLYNWIRAEAEAEAASAPQHRGKPGESELVRLKRENADLREENAFLKKAAAYFAKERPRGTRS